MRLLNFLRRPKSNILIVVLAFLISLLTISPVLKGGTSKVFYTIDPDVVYTANALLYIKSGYVSYFDHPGTPAIILMSLFLAPLRAYAKLIQHIPFISWVFNNYSLTFLYLRISQSVLLFGSLLTISMAIRILTGKTLPVLLLFLALLSFGSFYNLGAVISAETFAFFITSLWLLFISFHLKCGGKMFLLLLAFTAGIAFAGRATNFFLLPASLAVVLMEKDKLMRKISMGIITVGSMGVGFVIGISPTRTHIATVLKLVFDFAGTAGVHMRGEKTLFNFKSLISSVGIFLDRDLSATMIMAACIIFAIVYLFRGRGDYKKIAFIVLIFSLGATFFAKFPLAHYQITNYVVIVFCGTVVFSKLPNKLIGLGIIMLLFLFVPVANKHFIAITQLLNQSGHLEQFVRDNPAKFASVWGWVRTKEFAYIWNRNYADGMFDSELSNLPERIYEFKPDLMKIGVSKYTDVDIFDVCWDKLYVQKASLEPLVRFSPELGESVQKIPGEEIYLIQSNHCLPLFRD